VGTDIARLDNAAPYRKGGHRETCFSARVDLMITTSLCLIQGLLYEGRSKSFAIQYDVHTNGTDKTVTLFFNVISLYINTLLTFVKKFFLF